MARFHVWRLRSSNLLGIELQADLLDDLNTRILAPLLPADTLESYVDRLYPSFEIAGCTYVMMTQHWSGVPLNELGDVVAELSAKWDRITTATDFLFQGF
jgi:toxin CcdB